MTTLIPIPSLTREQPKDSGTVKDVLTASFSGGRTSAYMVYMLKRDYSDQYDIIPVFANTGQEHPKTLDFIKRCDDEWGFNTVWLEAVVHYGERSATTHKIVDYQSASRDGKPYLDITKKYGIANVSYLHCTREMKTNVIRSYRKEVGIYNSKLALGIRIDEPKRIKGVDVYGVPVIYPLVDWFPTTKAQILEWFRKQPFDLGLPEHLGNCVWCFKKTTNKLIKVAKDNKHHFDFPIMLENLYSQTGSGNVGRNIFRENRSANDILQLAYNEEFYNNQMDLIFAEDAINECGESCEPFSETPTPMIESK